MTTIVACYKWVVDEADLRINADLSLDITKAKGKISDYDKNAIRAAVQIAEATGGKAVGLSSGTDKTRLSLKDALSRGLDSVYWINAEEAARADGAVTARALSAALKTIDNVRLVICAEGASDTYARQTAPRIGAYLDWPVVTSVCSMEMHDTDLIAVRKLDDCRQKVKVALPAVVSVLPEINHAPIPGLKAVTAAGKKPVIELNTENLPVDWRSPTEVTAFKGYLMNRKNIIFKEGEAAEKVKELVASLKKEGVL